MSKADRRTVDLKRLESIGERIARMDNKQFDRFIEILFFLSKGKDGIGQKGERQ